MDEKHSIKPKINHPVSKEKGQLIKDPSHQQKSGSKAELLAHQIKEAFRDQPLIDCYLKELKAKYPRHMVDQLKVMESVIRNYPQHIHLGLEKAQTLNLISANDFRDIVFSLHKEAECQTPSVFTSDPKYSHLKAVERDADFYLKVLRGVDL